MHTMSQQSTSEEDVNSLNIDNLFAGNEQTKLSYTDYCAITQDFATMHINDDVLRQLELMGIPRKMVRDGLNRGELNHATTTYHLLV